MKKLILLFVVLIIAGYTMPVIAIESTTQVDKTKLQEDYQRQLRAQKLQLIEQYKLDTQKAKEQYRTTMTNSKDKLATFPGIREFVNKKVALGTGEITAITSGSLSVVKEGTTYTVLIDEQTQLRRKFWGKSVLSEFSVGDSVSVVGLWEDDAKTTIRARLIKNLSIQMRYGVFFGTVTEVTGSGFVMDTVRRELQTVTVMDSTVYTNRREETISKSDIIVGHRIRVRGLWNSTKSTITEVEKIKNFSLPPKASALPDATPAASAQ